ncbi:MAG: thioredoxin domain-containing protein [Candidatus Pacebacteria bacterium]|nr:thioredoxin domain-containing protein [Candidatus Paceibacterota bacterium]
MEPEKNNEGVAEVKQSISVSAAVLLGALMISISILVSGFIHAGPRTETNDDTETSVTADIKNVDIKDSPFIGEKNAPALAYYSDFQCPYCKKFDESVLIDLKKEYVDTGKIKIVFKDFAFLGPDSKTAALYGRSVWALYPEKYYDWRIAMFLAQDEEHGGFGDEASVKKLTGTIAGVDAEKVSADVVKNKADYQKMLDADYNEGKSLGVDGTPSILVGKTLIAGFYADLDYIEAVGKGLK